MKYALVTGGSRGIGRAICLKISRLGIPVLINYHSSQSAALEIQNQILSEGGKAELLQFDVSDASDVDLKLETWEQNHPDDYIAYLVNNAGIRKDNLMFMMPDNDWAEVLDVSLNGFFYVTKKLLPKMMRRRHGGRIVNIASLSGIKGLPGQANYSAAKAALIGATKALAQETAQRNVTVNAIAPGFISTDMTKELNEEELKELIPMKRFGTPDEVAGTLAFLLSDDASYITGEVININGGLYT